MTQQKSKLVQKTADYRLATATRLSSVSWDLHGPYTTEGVAGARYVAVAVDAGTAHTWVDVLLNKKAQTVAKSFTRYCCQVGIQGCVTTDNGQEFGRLFRELCDQKGTRSVRSEPYCPARNGLVERRNSLLKRMSRSMLVQSGLPMRYRPCSIQTAAYLLNRLPTKRLQGRTPHEAMHGFKPDVSHLRVFGSICYPLDVVKDPSSSVTAKPHIFVGYDDLSRGYRCLDPKTLNFKVRHSVQFDEQWRPRDVIVGSPISEADHPLLTSTPVVSAVGLPPQQPSSTKGVHMDVPCRASRPPLATTSPSSPLHSPSSISPSQQHTKVRQPSFSPAAHSSDGRFLRYTGKVSRRAPCILSRAERVGGHTFDQCRRLTYDKHGDAKVYYESDLQYDLDHGYLEYANACVKVKLPPRPRVC